MKSLIVSIFILLATLDLFARESLYRAEEPQATQESEEVVPKKESRPKKPTTQKQPPPTGNLVAEMSEAERSTGGAGAVIIPKGPVRHPSLKPGKSLIAEIEHTVVVFPESKTPVVARILSKGFEDMILIGEATLEKNSKGIAINFDRLSHQKENSIFQIKGSAQTEGEYHTNSDKLFVAEFLSAAAAGFVEASVQREQAVLGNYVETPSVENQAKRAGAGALAKSGERFAERVRSAREFSVLRTTIVHVLVLE